MNEDPTSRRMKLEDLEAIRLRAEFLLKALEQEAPLSSKTCAEEKALAHLLAAYKARWVNPPSGLAPTRRV